MGRPGHASCAVSYQSFFYTLAINYSDRAAASSFQSTSMKVFYICHAHWHTDVDGEVIFCTGRGPTVQQVWGPDDNEFLALLRFQLFATDHVSGIVMVRNSAFYSHKATTSVPTNSLILLPP